MRGDPRDEITRKIQELNADVLVVGSRGLGAIKRTFLVGQIRFSKRDCLLMKLNQTGQRQ